MTTPTDNNAALAATLARIADALDRLAPRPAPQPDLMAAEAYSWDAEHGRPVAVAEVARIDIVLLQGIALQRDLLLDNTRRFAHGLPANNALLWGARGMGKSSLVKSVHAAVNAEIAANAGMGGGRLGLVEIHREDIATLPKLLAMLRATPRPFVLYCDDLSFDQSDTSYKSLKAVLEGGLEGRPPNVLFYATSNRRHLLPRDMIENERSTAIHAGEAVEEKVSLSDRFGLWLGFHGCNQETYLAMIDGYAAAFGLDVAPQALHAQANEWSITRGARSGRVAWQFVQDLAGRLGRTLPAAG